ncbi:MAG TPA: methyltransferase domain-containing protein, partial [Armatimonadaceae bacterium]|nr:methyltransferase domain-containing protein [Armatimonadaceae bacterium]
MNQEDARRLVERGYDAMAEQYLASKDQEDPHFLAALKSLSVGLPQGAPVLDLGCGAGLPATRFLARRGFAVTGVDVSARQLELARLHVPEAAAFHRAD